MKVIEINDVTAKYLEKICSNYMNISEAEVIETLVTEYYKCLRTDRKSIFSIISKENNK